MQAIVAKGKETIHSGQFMVSQFEAEEQDDEYELAVPVPEEGNDSRSRPVSVQTIVKKTFPQQLTIDTSLSKLFQCMTIAYRQKLTSPKWNRFRGIRLRWKDKIRLNNVIWRCWHMQFIKKINTLICQFASPLDVDTHNKPEAIVLEGKYWKRKLAAVTAEYKKWRMYYRNNIVYGHNRDAMETLSDLDALNWHSNSNDAHMLVDEDYLGLMSDTLFSTITNHPFVFPDSREIAKAGLADFIQPSLGPLQPNLDDYMDTFEPLQEFISSKLPSVPEENGTDIAFKQENINWCYTDLNLMPESTNLPVNRLLVSSNAMQPYSSMELLKEEQRTPLDNYVPQVMLPLEYNVATSQTSNQVYQQALPLAYETSTSLVQANRGLKASTSEQNVFNPYSISRQSSSSQSHTQQSSQQQQITSNIDNFNLHADTAGFKFSAGNVTNLDLAGGGQEVVAKIDVRNAFLSKGKSAFHDSDPGQKEIRNERKPRGPQRGPRQRSISVSREPIKRPPLLTAISDPQLITPTNPSSVLLTQLLTGGSHSNLYTSTSHSSSGTGFESSQSNAIRIKEEGVMASAIGIPPSVTTNSLPPSTTASSSSSDTIINSMRASNSNSPTGSYGSHGTASSSCPTSPQDNNFESPGRDQKDQRRAGHIHAEQKRRYNIKNGFDMIHSLIPHLNQNFNAKLSKAAMLQKGAEYIRQLQSERKQLKEEMNSLKQQIDTLNTSISNCQSMLPSTGAPVSRKRDDKMQQMFDDFVRKKTIEDWRFWIFSLLFKPLLISFNNFVSTSSLDDLYRTTLQWVEQHCSLHDLRPIVLNSLRYVCTKTEILSAPEKLPEEARQAVQLNTYINQN